MPIKAYYNAAVSSFLKEDAERILGVLTAAHHHALVEQQRWAWLQQLSILKSSLANQAEGRIFLEFYIPRMGKRADALLIAANIIFVIEFKAGASGHASSAFDQVKTMLSILRIFMRVVIPLRSFRCWCQPMPNLSRYSTSRLRTTS
jgi:hypothetical protein